LLYTERRLPLPHSWLVEPAQVALQSASVARRRVLFSV
jgi:hypothetical protein